MKPEESGTFGPLLVSPYVLSKYSVLAGFLICTQSVYKLQFRLQLEHI